MKQVHFCIVMICTFSAYVCAKPVLEASVNGTTSTKAETNPSLVHFRFQTENGQKRNEDIEITEKLSDETYLREYTKDNSVKPVEYRGGYSFISADGYEYMVLYKANKNGFQPYVTARKLQSLPQA